MATIRSKAQPKPKRAQKRSKSAVAHAARNEKPVKVADDLQYLRDMPGFITAYLACKDAYQATDAKDRLEALDRIRDTQEMTPLPRVTAQLLNQLVIGETEHPVCREKPQVNNCNLEDSRPEVVVPSDATVTRANGAPTFTLGSFHRAFGDNYGYVKDGHEPDPLKLALDCIDDLKRTIVLCTSALHDFDHDSYETRAIIDVLTNAEYRAETACKVLSPFFLRAHRESQGVADDGTVTS
jgi:hypothetical protein